MGIRMHLALGYGLDLTILGGADRSVIDDYDQLEDEARFAAWKTDTLTFASAENDVMETMIFHKNLNPPEVLANLITYDTEFGFEDKLLLQPSASRISWTRYGDLLDTFLYEAQRDSNGPDWMEPEWIPHPGTLYPYTGLMKANPSLPLGVEKYWVPCYRDRPEHRDAIAWAPWHLWFLIKHLRLWPEDKTAEAFLSLRPVIYRHWS